ncbi:hypothetical protein V1477_017646 [Vespula maculifrons]|uniref:Uncharacterized protein n=1 Tax=Vespula maculifrons TaxID=7453 RepID=A0ABD2B6N1_VESMC
MPRPREPGSTYTCAHVSTNQRPPLYNPFTDWYISNDTVDYNSFPRISLFHTSYTKCYDYILVGVQSCPINKSSNDKQRPQAFLNNVRSKASTSMLHPATSPRILNCNRQVRLIDAPCATMCDNIRNESSSWVTVR